MVELSGNGISGNGLTLSGGASTVRGLAINRFGGAGIFILSGNGNTIESNFLGMDVTGTLATCERHRHRRADREQRDRRHDCRHSEPRFGQHVQLAFSCSMPVPPAIR